MSGDLKGHATKPPLLVHMFRKRLFEMWRTIFPKFGSAPSCWNRASQDNCGSVQCSNISRYERLVMVASWKKNGSMMWSFIMPHHVNFWRIPLMFDNFLRWLTIADSALMSVHDTIQTKCCLIRKTQESREISSLYIFCSILSQNIFLQSLSVSLMCCRNYNLYACKHKHLCTTSRTVVWGRCSSLPAVRIDLRELQNIR
jgi:hypothetical protein